MVYTCIYLTGENPIILTNKTNTVKPVNKGHSREGKDSTWSLYASGLYLEVMFYLIKENVITMWPLFTEWSLFEGGL